ncbi:MAG: DUF4358 domain-containing protein [Clostridia bacterium]|nr:DUF4358 domain-containing protein [Clostridia bacterium]
MKAIRKITAVILSAVMLCGILSACGDDAEEISMYDLNQALVGFTGDPDSMKYASSSDSNPEELLSHVSNIEYSKVKAFFITYATNGTGNADEIVAIQVKKKSDLNQAADSLRSHLETRKTLYAAYDKNQLPKLEKAKVFTRGTLAILMVSDNSDKMEAAFYGFFKDK